MMQHRGVAVAVSMKLAERSLAAAQAEADKLGETVEQAQRDQTLWQAVYPYKDYVLALKEAQDYKEMLSGANDQREPLMEKLATVAADYVAAMKHQVGVLGADRDKIRKQCDEIEQNAYLVENRAVKLDGDAFAAESEAKSYSQNLQARQTKFESLIKLEIVQKGESPAAALERIETAQKTRKSRLRSIERNREGNAELQEECARLLSEYQRSSAQKQADLAALEREYSRGCDERDKLENDKGFLSLLEAESIDLDDLSDEAAGILARAAACQENVARLRTEAAALERARVHIAEYGLMPPSVEVEALLKVIGRKVHAQSGWSYFAHDLQADEDEKERLVRKFPEIAQGIIVPRNEIHRVVELIESSPSDIPKLPVVIAAPEALYERLYQNRRAKRSRVVPNGRCAKGFGRYRKTARRYRGRNSGFRLGTRILYECGKPIQNFPQQICAWMVCNDASKVGARSRRSRRRFGSSRNARRRKAPAFCGAKKRRKRRHQTEKRNHRSRKCLLAPSRIRRRSRQFGRDLETKRSRETRRSQEYPFASR